MVWKFCSWFTGRNDRRSVYCILTGGSGSSLRAVMMLGVYFLSEILGEHYDMMSAGAFAGIVLLIMCPYRIYDTGFYIHLQQFCDRNLSTC